MFLIGGIAAVAFGILAFMNPGVALFTLGIFLAAYLLVDGISSIWGALSNRDYDGWVTVLLVGVLSTLAGGYALYAPAVGMIAIVYLVAFVSMMIGVTSIYIGWKIREEITGEWVLFVTGAISILFSLLILFRPAAGSLSVVYLIASWAVIIGLLRIFFAFRIRKLGNAIEEKAAPGGAG
jgi:uncharacterized membrane protein HdeD (DUF308 family)